MSDVRETTILHGPDFEDMLSKVVADAVYRANEATVARISALEDELATTKARLKEVERRLEDLDGLNRRNCVIISGIPEKDGESTDNLVADVGRAAGLQLSADSLDRSHRLGRAQPGKTRPIIARFVTTNTRQKLFDRRKELKSEKVGEHPTLTRPVVSRIYISECLSPRNQHLLFVARQLRKKKVIWAAYTTNGKVKVKKTEADAAKHVDDLDDLEGIVGGDVIREFRTREPAAAGAPAQRGTADPSWHAADAMNSWVTERRGRSAASRKDKGPIHTAAPSTK